MRLQYGCSGIMQATIVDVPPNLDSVHSIMPMSTRWATHPSCSCQLIATWQCGCCKIHHITLSPCCHGLTAGLVPLSRIAILGPQPLEGRKSHGRSHRDRSCNTRECVFLCCHTIPSDLAQAKVSRHQKPAAVCELSCHHGHGLVLLEWLCATQA